MSILLVHLVSALAPGAGLRPAARVLSAQFLTYGLWFLCLWGLFRFRYERPFWRSLAWVRGASGIARYAVWGPVLAFGVALAGAALRTPNVEMPMKDLLSDRFSLVLVGSFAVTLGPLCEELAFRGFLLPLVARTAGPAPGILMTAAAFSLLHGPQYAWSWQHVTLITAAGAAFGWVRLRSGSTAAAAVMHATYNLTFFAAYLAQWEDLSKPW
jgi:hypothetical protein